MKKILSPVLAVLMLAAMLVLPATANAAGEKVTYQKKDVTAYLFDKDTKKAMTCLFRPDMNLPYINATDYLNQIYTVEFKTADNGDGTFTISDKNGGFTVDPEKDTVHFDAFEKVLFYDNKPISEEMKADYLSDEEYKVDNDKINGLDLDFGKYNIDITAVDGNVYFPLTSIADMFAMTYQSAFYLNDSIYFTSVMDKPYYSDDSLYESLERDATLIDYTYNELCFMVDSFYGKPPKAKIAPSIAEKGFNKTLDEYNDLTKKAKQLLKSKDKLDFYFGLFYIDSLFFDGGHTFFSGLISQSLEKKANTTVGKALNEALGDQSNEKLEDLMSFLLDQQVKESLVDLVKATRNAAYDNYEHVKEWDKDIFLVIKDKTVIFAFNEFTDAVVKAFKWSLDYAKEKGVENFVIDLSCNGGGSSSVAIYMLSIMTGNGELSLKNVATGSILNQSAKIDKNLDGKFDEKDDEVKYDFNYGIITSPLSFSSANLMACIAQERGVKILGENSGGGTCMLLKPYYPEPFNYAMSGTLMMVNKDGKDIDSGAKPDAVLVVQNEELTDYSGLYDMDKLNAALKGGSDKKTDPATAGEAASTPGEKTDSPSSSGNGIPVFVWVLIGVGAAAIIVIIVLLIKKKKK